MSQSNSDENCPFPANECILLLTFGTFFFPLIWYIMRRNTALKVLSAFPKRVETHTDAKRTLEELSNVLLAAVWKAVAEMNR